MRGIRVTVCLGVVVLASAAAQAAPAVQYAGETMRLKGHTGAPLAAAVSADGKRIATAGNDGLAIVWDAETGKVVHRLEGHAEGVSAVGFSADGRRVVTASFDQTARVWDAGTGEVLAILKGGHTLHVHAAAISPDGARVVTGSCDRSAVLWDVAAEKPLHRFRFGLEVHGVAFAPDGKTFMAGGKGPPDGVVMRPGSNNLRLYDAATGAPLHDFGVATVDRIVYVPGGTRAFASSGSQVVAIDVEARTAEVADFGRHLGAQELALAVSADGKRLLAGSNHEARLIDLGTKKALRVFDSFGHMVRAVALAPDGTWAVMGGGGLGRPWVAGFGRSADSDVRVVATTAEVLAAGGVAPRPAQTDPARRAVAVRAVAASADGGRMFVVFGGGAAVWWDAATGVEAARVQLDKPPGVGPVAAMSADGSRVALIPAGGSPDSGGAPPVTVYDAGGKAVVTVGEMKGRVAALALSADGASMFAGSVRRTMEKGAPRPVAQTVEIRQFDVASGAGRRTFNGPAGAVAEIAVGCDGRTLLALVDGGFGAEACAVAFDVASGRQLWQWSPPAGARPGTPMAGAAIAADGRHVAFAHGATAFVVEADTGKPVATLTGHESDVRRIAFDPDGRRVWTNIDSHQGDVRAWGRADGKQERAVEVKGFGRAFRFDAGRHLLLEVRDGKLVEHALDP